MSVHQESLEMAGTTGQLEEPPELEYSALRNDSLTMFGAAIGGAVLGMLLTLLVLAIINGGTLSFTGGERLDVMEASLVRVDENVGYVAYNVGVVAEQAQEIQSQLLAVENTLRQELDSGQQEIATLEDSVGQLESASAQFTLIFMALDEALTSAAEAMSDLSAAR
jgi:hypothetical protein